MAAYDQVTVQMPGGGYNLLSQEEFERMPLAERIDLLLKGKLVFLKEGRVIPLEEALNATPPAGA